MSDDHAPPRPARREPMLWLVFGLPAVVVAASLATVWISARGGANDAVPDRVRRTAQIQTTELGPDHVAAAANYTAVLSVRDGSVAVLPVTGAFARRAPLELRLAHPVQARHDLRVVLRPDATGWSARAAVARGHDWNVSLQDPAGHWRIVGRLQAGEQAVRLAPALPAP